jgi:outer membrane protein assembly factor BamB
MSKILRRKTLKIFSLGLFLVASLLLTGCSGGLFSASSWPGVTIDGTTLYVAYGTYVYAFDVERGSELWHFPAEVDRTLSFYAAPAVTDKGLVVVGGYDNSVYPLDSETGSISGWNSPFEDAKDRIIGAPLIFDDWILVPSADGRLYAIDMETGQPVWEKPYQESEDPGPLWSSPIVDGNTIYLASLDHHVYAIELSTGEEIWRTMDLGGAISDSPALSDGLILVGTFGESLIAIDATDGKIEWSYDTAGWVWSSPVVFDGVAYFGDTAGFAYAVEVETGNELWQKSIDGAIGASPAVDENGVYFVTETGSVHAANPNSGGALWPNDTILEGQLLSDPILHDGQLYLGAITPECIVYAVETDNGRAGCAVSPVEQ